jgi:serine/threonine protein kinase
MQPTTVQLWERIHSSGLASPEECRRWAKSVAAAVGKEALSDPGLLTKELVGQGYLTPYQANVLYKGMSHPVQLGAIRVVRSLESEWGPYWYQGVSGDQGTESNYAVVAIAAPSLVSGPLHDWPPSMVWAEEHCKAKSEHLDEWNVSGATLQHLFVAGTRTNEPTLSARLMDGPLDSEACAQMARDVACGLQAMHESGLVHGRISLDAIQCTAEGGFRLLRDPLFPPASAYGAGTPSVLGGDQDRFAVSAPELACSGAKPTEQSDLYALGCVWFRALSGQWPFQPGIDAPPGKWAMLHAQIPVLIPDGLNDALAKCLMHLLAKSPSVRFRNATDFLQALRFAGFATNKNAKDRQASPAVVTVPSPGNVAREVLSEVESRRQSRETNQSVDTGAVSPLPAGPPTGQNEVPEVNAPKKASPEKASPEKKGISKSESGQEILNSTNNKSGDLKSGPSKVEGGKSSPSRETSSEPGARSSKAMRAAEESGRESKGGTPRPTPSQDQKSAAAVPQPTTPTALPAVSPSQSGVASLGANLPNLPAEGTNTKNAASPVPQITPIPGAPSASAPAVKPTVANPEQGIGPTVLPPLVEISNPLLGASKATSEIKGPSNGEAKAEAKVEAKVEVKAEVKAEVKSDGAAHSNEARDIPSGSEVKVKSGAMVEPKSDGSQDVADRGADKVAGAGSSKPTIVLDKLNAFDVKEGGTKKKKKKPRSKDGDPKGKKVAEIGGRGVKGKRKAKRPVWFMPMVFVCSLLMMLLLVLVLRNTNGGVVKIKPQDRNKVEVAQNDTVISSVASDTGKERVAIDPMLEYFALKEDDGKSPWTPPTIGSPYSTDMLPMGIETLVFLSGAAIEKRKPVDQLLQWWQDVQGNALSIPEFAWVNREGLDSVAIAWYPGAEISTFQRVVRFTYTDSKPLAERIVASEAMEPKKVTSESGPSQTFWIAPVDGQQVAFAAEELRSDANASVKRITVGPVGLIEQLAKNQGKSGPLRRQMEVLLQATDSRADVTVLAAPSFLYGDGKLLMGEHSGKVLSLLRSFVDDNVQALMIRTHLEPAWYVEVRTLGNDLQSAFRDAAEARKRLEGLPDEMESRFTAKPADPYWRALANRYPQMLRKLVGFTRAASEDGQVVLNAYLPSEAVLNMTISSWMALQADTGATTSKVAVAKPTPTTQKTPEELLEAKISIKLEQESLEAVLQAISNEVRDSHTGGVEALPMAINGGAFQKEGITRNQQIRGFDFKETSLRQVLTALARRANPVTTVKSPNEKDQKVVWVLLDDPATPSKKKLEMTTRVWADANQANLPTEFVLPKE